MALFKMNRGNSNTLPTKLTDGYAYFCTDTAEFFIDYADLDGTLYRKKLNAKDAETLTGMSLDQIKEYNLTQFYTKTEVNNKTTTAEQNAKNYANNLNSSMDSRVQALESIDFEGAAQELLIEAKAYTDANSFKVEKVNSLPTIGDKSTIYVKNSEEFIWVEKSGTPVPNDGTVVDTIYFNTELQIDEVVSSLKSVSGWTLADPTMNLSIYFIAMDELGETGLAAFESGGIYGIADYSFFVSGQGNIYFASQSVADFGITTAGWLAGDKFSFGTATTSDFNAMSVGAENDKLANVFSITSFAVDGGGTHVPGTAVTSGINKVYLDTTKSIEEVDAILSQLTQWNVTGEPNGEESYIIGVDSQLNKMLSVFRYSTQEGYFIGLVDYTTWTSTPIYSTVDGGWLITNSVFDLGFTTTLTAVGNATVGEENNLISEIISATPLIINGEWEKLGSSLEGYATEEYVNNTIANIPGVDLSGYVKLSDLPALLDEYMQWGKFSDLV